MPSFLLYHRYKILSSKKFVLKIFFCVRLWSTAEGVHRNKPKASEENERSEVRNSRPEMAKPAQGTPYYKISSILSRINNACFIFCHLFCLFCMPDTVEHFSYLPVLYIPAARILLQGQAFVLFGSA